jgi:gas vesicle protein
MSQEKMSVTNVALLSFIGGAVLGAAVVALTTPKSGPEVREDLKALGRRAKGKVGEMSDQVGEAWTTSRDRAGQGRADLGRGMHDASEDFKRGLREATEDLRRGMHEAAADLRGRPGAPEGSNLDVKNGVSLT